MAWCDKHLYDVILTINNKMLKQTVAAISAFTCAMVLLPQIQKQTQPQIDCAVGTDRLSSYQDQDSLPYLEAIYRELMRRRPPLPLEVPHAPISDEVYNGYCMPKSGFS